MVSIGTARILALTFPGVDEYLHFDKPAFRVNKKIFATLHVKDKRMMVKLSLIDQSVFCSINAAMIFPVPGGWGRKGATFVELAKVPKKLLKDAIGLAYAAANSKKVKSKK